jgi:hypothetical protein
MFAKFLLALPSFPFFISSAELGTELLFCFLLLLLLLASDDHVLESTGNEVTNNGRGKYNA